MAKQSIQRYYRELSSNEHNFTPPYLFTSLPLSLCSLWPVKVPSCRTEQTMKKSWKWRNKREFYSVFQICSLFENHERNSFWRHPWEITAILSTEGKFIHTSIDNRTPLHYFDLTANEQTNERHRLQSAQGNKQTELPHERPDFLQRRYRQDQQRFLRIRRNPVRLHRPGCGQANLVPDGLPRCRCHLYWWYLFHSSPQSPPRSYFPLLLTRFVPRRSLRHVRGLQDQELSLLQDPS